MEKDAVMSAFGTYIDSTKLPSLQEINKIIQDSPWASKFVSGTGSACIPWGTFGGAEGGKEKRSREDERKGEGARGRRERWDAVAVLEEEEDRDCY